MYKHHVWPPHRILKIAYLSAARLRWLFFTLCRVGHSNLKLTLGIHVRQPLDMEIESEMLTSVTGFSGVKGLVGFLGYASIPKQAALKYV